MISLNSIKTKFFLLIGKALLTAVNSTGAVGYYPAGSRKNPQRVSVNWLGTMTDIEHAQPYGFESYPAVGTAKAVILCPDGARSNAFVMMVQDDEHRPDDLSEGDSCQYDKDNARILCSGGKIAMGNPDQTLTSTPSGGKANAMEIVDRLFTLLQGTLNLGGVASMTTFLPTVNAELAKLQVDWNKIKGSL